MDDTDSSVSENPTTSHNPPSKNPTFCQYVSMFFQCIYGGKLLVYELLCYLVHLELLRSGFFGKFGKQLKCYTSPSHPPCLPFFSKARLFPPSSSDLHRVDGESLQKFEHCCAFALSSMCRSF